VPLPIMLASTPPPAEPGGFVTLMPLVIIVAVFYFLLIRPQQKQQKEHTGFLGGVKAGDQVLTQSGIIGKVIAIDAGVVTLEIARDTKVRLLLRSLAGPHSPAKK
jgi:preprotein translocase subunit YajC